MRFFCFLAALAALSASPAQGQEPLSQVRTAAFLEVVAIRGMECGLMRPWQAAALRALNRQDMARWDNQRREQLIPEITRQLAETDCDNQTVQVWIEGSSRGFDSEMLPPYLVAYRTMASMQEPPQVFAATALRLDYAPAIDAIDAKFAELAASGAVAEGGYSWPEYIERTEGFIEEFAATLADPEATGEAADEAASWLAQSALIVELWLMDELGS
ncbi:MAG: hypothetical protein PVI23_03235 [Maricaulaceae bacterium]|jgi:hypothetical protein